MTPLKILQLWVFASVDDDGNEGVCGFHTAEGWMPMVAADEARLSSLRPMAAVIAQSHGRRVILLRFRGKGREELESFEAGIAELGTESSIAAEAGQDGTGQRAPLQFPVPAEGGTSETPEGDSLA